MCLILVVDDEVAVRTLLRRMLEGAGYSVIEAEDGRVGTCRFHEASPDLVLVDMFMPVKEGIETMREIRATRSDAKIIAMSGGGSFRFDVLDGIEALGASATLNKPFSKEQLLATVARVLRGEYGR